jgi:hypothetical protein
MPAKSRARRRAAGAALSAGCGKTTMKDLEPPAKSMARSMSEPALEDMASTPRRGKPEHRHDA